MSQSFLLLPTPMKRSRIHSRWSELETELLDLVVRNLTNYADYVRIRAVCPSWRSKLPRKPYHILTQLPWLLFPQDNNTIISETRCIFFNLADNKSYYLELPEVLGNGKRCWGSPHGWLVFLREEGPSFSLLNPLTRAEIRIPSFFFFPSLLPSNNIILPWDSIGCLRNSYVSKAVLIANPDVKVDFVIVVLLEGGPCGLAFFRSGTEAWTLITNTEGIIFHDVVYFGGQFYAVDKDGNVYFCNLGASPPNVVQVAYPPPPLPLPAAATATAGIEIEDEPSQQNYLVESAKDLYLVYRYMVSTHATPFLPTYHFSVHKLNPNDSTWLKILDLGDQVFFLGTNRSFSLSARDYPCCRKNSIYFSDDQRYPIAYVGDSESRIACTKGHDSGVFNLDGGYVERFSGFPVPYPYKINCILPAPVWITLSP